MASELLAEFDSFYRNPGNNHTSGLEGSRSDLQLQPLHSDLSLPQSACTVVGTPHHTEDAASNSENSQDSAVLFSKLPPKPQSLDTSGTLAQDLDQWKYRSQKDPSPGMRLRHEIKASSNNIVFVDLGSSKPAVKPQEDRVSAEVLFDFGTMQDYIENDSDEEFGGFESSIEYRPSTLVNLTATTPEPPRDPEECREAYVVPVVDHRRPNLSIVQDRITWDRPLTLMNKSDSQQERNEAIKSSAGKPSPILPKSMDEKIDNPCGDFVESSLSGSPDISPTKGPQIEISASNHTATSPNKLSNAPSSTPQVFSAASTKHGAIALSSQSASRPTNLPPPSVLLPLFPPLFLSFPSDVSNKDLIPPVSSMTQIQNKESTAGSLRQYLALAVVVARIIAGRRVRWKRDSFLAQGMRIGPARSGKIGGMKLVGIDKSETLKEDREVADVVRVWKEKLGRLRSAVTAFNAMKDGPLAAIPEVSERPSVRSAKEAEGAMVAAYPCAICGLKREERVEKVDVNVEDTFGEWWVDHWGHRACKSFWDTHQSDLQQR
ncbi:MAG: hypothetical protein M1827_006815 [Pycnora praestabilis]|nr:MAG: hypothetical protein M1827_006815 [Pycnora praestabilis]